jgi:hypothetical protein
VFFLGKVWRNKRQRRGESEFLGRAVRQVVPAGASSVVDEIFSRVQNVSDLRLSRSTLARMLSFAKRLNGILQCLHADKSQRCSRSVAPIRVADRGGASSRATVHCTPPEIFPHRWQLAGFPGDLRQLAGALPTVSDAHTVAVGPMLPLRRCMAWKGSELAGRLSDETRSALEHRMNAKGAIVPSKDCRRQGGDIAGIGVRLFCPTLAVHGIVSTNRRS